MQKDHLYHSGIKGMRWGIRRFQNEDGSLTAEGKKRYGAAGIVGPAQEAPKGAKKGPTPTPPPKNAKTDGYEKHERISLLEKMKKHQEEDVKKKWGSAVHKKMQSESPKSLMTSGLLALGLASLSNKIINKYDAKGFCSAMKPLNYATMIMGGAEVIAAGQRYIGYKMKQK